MGEGVNWEQLALWDQQGERGTLKSSRETRQDLDPQSHPRR